MTFQLIETKSLGTASASIEFTSIPQTFTDLYLVAALRADRANIQSDIAYRFNGDTAANYVYQLLGGTGSGVAAFRSASVTFNYLGASNGNSSTANSFSNQSLYIPNYTAATAKTSSADSVYENNATAAEQLIVANIWSGTAAITSILVYSANTVNLMAGSTISLYGITKGSDGIVTTS
jgi:hypothetical protein